MLPLLTRVGTGLVILSDGYWKGKLWEKTWGHSEWDDCYYWVEATSPSRGTSPSKTMNSIPMTLSRQVVGSDLVQAPGPLSNALYLPLCTFFRSIFSPCSFSCTPAILKNYIIHHLFKGHNLVVLLYSWSCATITTISFRTLSSPPLIAISSYFPYFLALSHSNHLSTFCFCRSACSEHFIKRIILWSFVIDFFHLAWCLQGSSML